MKEKEHQSIEWKESWQDEYLKWICGYANAYGGIIYIGTDDDVILSILVYTLFSRMFDLMQPPVVKHSIAVA